MKKVKLYNVPNNSRIGVEHLGMINEDTKEPIRELEFKHIDGMYSLCYNYSNKEAIHLSSSTEVYVL